MLKSLVSSANDVVMGYIEFFGVCVAYDFDFDYLYPDTLGETLVGDTVAARILHHAGEQDNYYYPYLENCGN